MARIAKPKRDRRQVRVMLALSPDEHARIARGAKSASLAVAAYARMRLLTAVNDGDERNRKVA
jgi:hypothetical protein